MFDGRMGGPSRFVINERWVGHNVSCLMRDWVGASNCRVRREVRWDSKGCVYWVGVVLVYTPPLRYPA